MRKRPLSITVIGVLFVVTGGIALVAGLLPAGQRLTEFKEHPAEAGLVVAVRVIGVLCGVFLLYGFNWARWLLTAWLAFHVALSVTHSRLELLIHSLLFGVVFYFLFRPPASRYFSGRATGAFANS